MNQPIYNKTLVKGNKEIAAIQKETNKKYKKTRVRNPKMKMGRLVKLRSENPFVDCTSTGQTEENEKNFKQVTAEQILDCIRENDIYGRSGSGFPTAKKIEALMDSGAQEKVLIVNAVACDPGLVQDAWLLENHLEEVEQGISYLKQCCNFKKMYLACRDEITVKSTDIQAVVVPNRYPMGEEKVLAGYILQRDFRTEDIPVTQGIMVTNVQTVYSICLAMKGCCDATRFLTVAEMVHGTAVVAKAEIGQSVYEVLEKTLPESCKKGEQVYYGGGLMYGGKAEEDAVVGKETCFIAVGPMAEEADINNRCKGCGACTAKCPKRIPVHKVVRAVAKNRLEELKKYPVDQCLQCGLCNFVCGAGRDNMKMMKECAIVKK